VQHLPAATQASELPLPRLSGRLLTLVIRRARQLQPVHWRQAIDSLLTHSTRAQPALRDFLKQVCRWQLPDPQPPGHHDLWVDQARLEALIDAAAPLCSQFVARHRWALARCFSPASIKGTSLLPDGQDIQLDAQLSALVCLFAPEHWQQQLHAHLKPQQEHLVRRDPDHWEQYASHRIRRLQDALASGWQLRSLAGHDSRTALPRDLTDIAAWLDWWLDSAAPVTLPLTLADFHALLWQAFDQVLGRDASVQQVQRRAPMQPWFAHRFPMNNSLVDKVFQQRIRPARNAFEWQAARQEVRFNTSAPAVQDLFLALYQDMARSALAVRRNRAHGGRQSTLVEGPAGRGKDACFQLAFKAFEQQAGTQLRLLRVDAGASWKTVRASIDKARRQGSLLLIPELNLVATGHLEGELNAVLTGEAAPGFYLFATVNPAGQGGRSRLSPALLGRFRRLVLRDYNKDEWLAIAQTALAKSEQQLPQACRLVHWHCQLCRQLEKKGLTLRPGARHLRQLGASLAHDPGQDMVRAFERHYQVYLALAGTHCAQLETAMHTQVSIAAQPDGEACQWVNAQRLADAHPWQVVRGSCNALKPDEACILLDRTQDGCQARIEMTCLLGRYRWQGAGLPADPAPAWSDLEKLCYRLCQRNWCRQFWPQEQGAALNRAFPLDAAMQQFLSSPGNRQPIQRVQQRLTGLNPGSPAHWPACWGRLQSLLDQHGAQWLWSDAVGPSAAVAAAADGRVLGNGRLPRSARAGGSAGKAWSGPCLMDRNTEPPTRPLSPGARVFQDDGSTLLDRLVVLDMAVKSNGDILLTQAPPGSHGFEVVMAAPLILPCCDLRQPGESYGVFCPPDRD